MKDESTVPMPARAYDATIKEITPEGEIVKIEVPGTSAVLEIDAAAFEVLAQQPANADDFQYLDAHNGDNYGKPKLSGS